MGGARASKLLHNTVSSVASQRPYSLIDISQQLQYPFITRTTDRYSSTTPNTDEARASITWRRGGILKLACVTWRARGET